MSIAINTSPIVQGFALATVIPAMASTLKQAQREAADALHCLARYYARVVAAGGAAVPVDAETRRAARHFGRVLVEQTINGSTFFLAVKLALLSFGAIGGVAAQLAITGNTIITPRQTQQINPARMLFDALGTDPNWVDSLSDRMLKAFAYQAGAFAAFCGYGNGRAVISAPRPVPESGCRLQVVEIPWPRPYPRRL